MEQYLDALRQVVETGVDRSGRNGDTRAVFGDADAFRHVRRLSRRYNEAACV